MAFTTAEVNTWFQTIDGLPVTTAPIPSNLSTAYVNGLNSIPPTTSEPQVQAQLENQTAPPPNNVATDTFYRTSVAQFVLRDFQAAWGVVPTSTQFDAWVARVIATPSLESGGMSQALAGTPQFLAAYGLTSSTQLATTGFINQLLVNLGLDPATHPGAFNNVGVPVAQVLQNFVTSQPVIASLNTPIVNFQNALLAGGTFPTGSILTVGPGGALNLTTAIDTPTAGFSTGHGGTATQPGATFSALPGSNVLGASNTLNAGDDLEATGAALGDSTLNYTAVLSATGNPALVSGLTMNGVSAANITNLNAPGVQAGFSGTITGLTTATLTAADTGPVTLGTAGNGLNTALTTVNVNAGHNFTAHMTAAAFAVAPTGTVNVNGGVTTVVALDSLATTGYASLTVNSGGPGGTTANDVTLNLNEAVGTTNTTSLTVTGAEALVISGSALDIDNLHTFNANSSTAPDTPDTGGVDAIFTNADGVGHVDATGGSGVNTFEFGAVTVAGPTLGQAGFTAASTVDGGTGTTNTLIIDATNGAILATGVGPNITDIATIEHSGVQNGTPLTADLALMGSATTFDLAGTYDNLVTVNDITNAQTVEYSALGSPTASPTDLVLLHATPVVATDVINFEMNSSLTSALTLAQLTVAAGLSAVNIDSTGTASDNIISNVSTIADNITVTGGTHLILGDSAADAYALPNGTINAIGATAGVDAFLSPTAGTAQTFVAGGGTNFANLFSAVPGAAGGGVVDFSHGGTDTVQFNDTQFAGFALNDTAHNFNQVLGFTAALDSVNVSVSGIPTVYTDTAAPVAALDPTTAFNFTTGTSVSATTTHSNLIDITTPITTTAGETAQAAFSAAIGTAAANGITVSGILSPVLLSFYDNTTGQAVLATATPDFPFNPFVIDNASTIHVVGLIHESAAAYASIASQVHFVA
jgi:hypothetical protein